MSETENVECSIRITIVYRPARAARPNSYSKTCDTFRPRVRQRAATRTGLGWKFLIDFFEHNALPDGFVLELCSERSPRSIVHGLSHARFCQRFRVHVSYENCCMFSHQRRRFLMDSVFTLIANPGVDSLDTAFLVCALSNA